MADYVYLPLTGELSGKSFEEQTIAFFERLQQQIDNINSSFAIVNQLDEKITIIDASLESINEQMAAVNAAATKATEAATAATAAAEQAESTIVTVQASVTTAQETATAAQLAAQTAQKTANAANTAATDAASAAAAAQTTADAAATLAHNAETSAAAALAGNVPDRGIVLLNNDITNVPAGWYVADGTNGTPDLTASNPEGARAIQYGNGETPVTSEYTIDWDNPVTVVGESGDAVQIVFSPTSTGLLEITDSQGRAFNVTGIFGDTRTITAGEKAQIYINGTYGAYVTLDDGSEITTEDEITAVLYPLTPGGMTFDTTTPETVTITDNTYTAAAAGLLVVSDAASGTDTISISSPDIGQSGATLEDSGAGIAENFINTGKTATITAASGITLSATFYPLVSAS